MKAIKVVGIQYAALPFRIEARQLRVLLITSRETRRWVIPKGWPVAGLKAHEVAALEASEEAGLAGEVAEQPIGSYHYVKRLKGERSTAVQVIVFPFSAERHAETWKEQGQRSHGWFSYARAARLVAEPGLKRLIRELGVSRSPGLLARGLRRYRAWRLTVRARPSLG